MAGTTIATGWRDSRSDARCARGRFTAFRTSRRCGPAVGIFRSAPNVVLEAVAGEAASCTLKSVASRKYSLIVHRVGDGWRFTLRRAVRPGADVCG